jgi:hypothetical protein
MVPTWELTIKPSLKGYEKYIIKCYIIISLINHKPNIYDNMPSYLFMKCHVLSRRRVAYYVNFIDLNWKKIDTY